MCDRSNNYSSSTQAHEFTEQILLKGHRPPQHRLLTCHILVQTTTCYSNSTFSRAALLLWVFFRHSGSIYFLSMFSFLIQLSLQTEVLYYLIYCGTLPMGPHFTLYEGVPSHVVVIRSDRLQSLRSSISQKKRFYEVRRMMVRQMRTDEKRCDRVIDAHRFHYRH